MQNIATMIRYVQINRSKNDCPYITLISFSLIHLHLVKNLHHIQPTPEIIKITKMPQNCQQNVIHNNTMNE